MQTVYASGGSGGIGGSKTNKKGRRWPDVVFTDTGETEGWQTKTETS